MKKILLIIAIICAVTAHAQNDFTPLKQSTFNFEKESFHELRCSVPVSVTYTVTDSVAPSVSPIGLNVYVDCVDVRVENNTLFLNLNLPDYMNTPGANELQINIIGPALTKVEADGKCFLVTIGNQTFDSQMEVYASDGANILLRDYIKASQVSASASDGSVIGFFTVNTPRMNVRATDMSIINIYSPPSESGTSHVGKLELHASRLSTVTVSNTTYDSVTEDKDDESKIKL